MLPLLQHQKESQHPKSRGAAVDKPMSTGDGTVASSASSSAADTHDVSVDVPYSIETSNAVTEISTTSASTKSTRASSAASDKARLLTVLFLYCTSGTALTLANKLAVTRFPYPNLILVIQNGMAVVTLALGSCVIPLTIGRMPRLSWPLFRLWAPLTVTFSLMLASSMLALQEVSAVTLIVIRNLTSLTVATLEFACLGTALPWQSAGALLGILCGAIMYSLHDITFSPIGYFWLLLNLLSTSVYQVWVKRVIASDAGKKIGALGMSYVNNMLSLPVLVAIALASGEILKVLEIDSAGVAGFTSSRRRAFRGIFERADTATSTRSGSSSGFASFSSPTSFSSPSSFSSFLVTAAATTSNISGKASLRNSNGSILTLLLGSGALGICLSVTAFMLNALISATSMMVTNNVNKFFVIMLSECFIQRTLDGVSSLGIAVVMVFGWLYGEASKRTAAPKAAAKTAKATAFINEPDDTFTK